MKKSKAWLINIGLIVVGLLLIAMFFSINRDQHSQSENVIEQLLSGNISEAFRTIQQVNLNSDEIYEIKDVLLLKTLEAVEMWDEEQLMLLKAFINNAPVQWGPSFHMPILLNINIFLEYIDTAIILECHEDNHEVLSQLRQYVSRFTQSILPYFRNGLVQALNNSRVHYNNALVLQDMLNPCYSKLNYHLVLEAGLSFMSSTLSDPTLSNFNSLRTSFTQREQEYDVELDIQQSKIDVAISRKNSVLKHIQRHQEQINAIKSR